MPTYLQHLKVIRAEEQTQLAECYPNVQAAVVSVCQTTESLPGNSVLYSCTPESWVAESGVTVFSGGTVNPLPSCIAT